VDGGSAAQPVLTLDSLLTWVFERSITSGVDEVSAKTSSSRYTGLALDDVATRAIIVKYADTWPSSLALRVRGNLYAKE
jgi:hypothetical protein